MKEYLYYLEKTLDEGVVKNDRTGVGTRSLFGVQMRYDLSRGFPAVTTKRLAFRAVVGELLWFIEGSGDERRLAEITHGSRDGSVTIWTPNALAPYWTPKAKFEGDLGRVYGVQWRKWQKYVVRKDMGPAHLGGTRVASDMYEIDQLAILIDGIKTNPDSRRHILNAWNVSDLDDMALPPCHVLSQFYVANGKLSCHMYQRSGDAFLGIPFNIASYSLLTHMIAQVCGLKVGEFVHTIGDFHIYNDHVEQVKEQISRQTLPLPTLWLNSDIKTIDDFKMDDIRLQNYIHHPPLKASMAV